MVSWQDPLTPGLARVQFLSNTVTARCQVLPHPLSVHKTTHTGAEVLWRSPVPDGITNTWGDIDILGKK